MSPGIRSGVNWTRLVSHRERGGQAAHQQRLRDARARPPSARGRRTAARPAGRRPRRPGRRRPWPPRPARRRDARAPRRCSATGRGSGLGVGHAWDTSLSSSSSCRARSTRSRSWAVGRPSGPSRAVDLVDAARPVCSATASASEHVGSVWCEPSRSRSASLARAARPQRLGGVAAVAGPAVEAAEVAGRLDGPTATGSGSTASGPSRRARQTTQRHDGHQQQPEAGHEPARAAGWTGETPSPPTRSSSDGTYQTRCGPRPEQPQRHGRVVALEDLVVGQGAWGAEQQRARPAARRARTPPRPRKQPPSGVDASASSHLAARARRTTGSRRRPGRRPGGPSRRTPPMAPSSSASAGPGATTTTRPASPGWSSSRCVVRAAEVARAGHHDQGRRRRSWPVERVGARATTTIDTLVVEHPGQGLGAVAVGVVRVERAGVEVSVPTPSRWPARPR